MKLYAKFTANNYNIFYELDGGSNGEGNPDSYTYGIGVASLADAEKKAIPLKAGMQMQSSQHR